MSRFYCSGFDVTNAFGHGLGNLFKEELKECKSIVYIPGGLDKIEKAKTKYIPLFREQFQKIGIVFKEENLITTELSTDKAKTLIQEANFIMLMGGNPFKQKELCSQLGILEELKKYNGVMVGFSAGAMLMSKYIIITPCSDEYPEFRVEEGLNLDEISIYPHNNISLDKYPEVLNIGEETYKKEDLLIISKKYGEFYLLQDHLREDGKTAISIIMSKNGKIEYYRENDGKIWIVTKEDIILKKL